MAATLHETGIEWTHVPGYKGATWNPVRGCTKVSPGCKNCYAETFAERWRGKAGHPYEQGFDLRLVPEKLGEPLRKTKPHAYFVNSMSDLFQEGVPFDFTAMVMGIVAAAPRHLHMVLTKRAGRMKEWFDWIACGPDASDTEVSICKEGARGYIGGANWPSGKYSDADPWPNDASPVWPPPNLWLGVSVEDRKYGLPRVDILRTIPAAVRFLSVEPLLEDLGNIDLTDIHWVIIGGESGPGARPFDLAWARRIVDQCKEQGVPVFMKQLGARPGSARHVEDEQHGIMIPLLLKSRKGGDESEWPEDLRGLKQWPKVVVR